MATRKRTKKAKKAKLIPAVGYLRKSTKGKAQNGRQRQENSLPRQKQEVFALAEGKYEIVAWFEDDGISGTKMGAKRPGFDNMLRSVKRLGAKAIICEKVDRFSRASLKEVRKAGDDLVDAGVQWVVTRGTTYDLTEEDDLGAILQFVIDVWAANKYSKDLAERVLMSKRNLALAGKRTGGTAPYGMERNGKSLKPGKPSEIKVVRFIFNEFVSGRSINSISGELNRQGIKTVKGGPWRTETVKTFLKRAAYVGDLVWNDDPAFGKHFVCDDQGNVVRKTDGVKTKTIVHKNKWKGIISRSVWNKAQERLASFSKRKIRPRGKYALSGVIICDRCGAIMHPATPSRTGRTVYRCSTPSAKGAGTCGNFYVNEDVLLPKVLKLLVEELEKLDSSQLASTPPENLTSEQERSDAIEERKNLLQKQIELATENLMFSDDARTRTTMDAKITQMRDELAELSEIHVEVTDDGREKALDWWRTFLRNAKTIPIEKAVRVRLARLEGTLYKATGNSRMSLFTRTSENGKTQWHLRIDPGVLNAALISLGCEVRLRWSIKQEVRKGDGKVQNRYTFQRGRLKLGQKTQKLGCHALSTSSVSGCWCTGCAVLPRERPAPRVATGRSGSQ